ncbi:MAG: hypothetical protein QM784_24000 [Polyangiaceae bacterium]
MFRYSVIALLFSSSLALAAPPDAPKDAPKDGGTQCEPGKCHCGKCGTSECKCHPPQHGGCKGHKSGG